MSRFRSFLDSRESDTSGFRGFLDSRKREEEEEERQFGIGPQLAAAGAVHQDDVAELGEGSLWRMTKEMFKANTLETFAGERLVPTPDSTREDMQWEYETPQFTVDQRRKAEGERVKWLAENPTGARLYASSVIDVAADPIDAALGIGGLAKAASGVRKAKTGLDEVASLGPAKVEPPEVGPRNIYSEITDDAIRQADQELMFPNSAVKRPEGLDGDLVEAAKARLQVADASAKSLADDATRLAEQEKMFPTAPQRRGDIPDEVVEAALEDMWAAENFRSPPHAAQRVAQKHMRDQIYRVAPDTSKAKAKAKYGKDFESQTLEGYSDKYSGDVSPTKPLTFREMFEKTYQKWVHSGSALEDLAGQVGKKTRSQMTRMLARLRGNTDISVSPIFHQTQVWSEGQKKYVKTGESLREIVGGLTPEYQKKLNAYLMIRRNEELATRAEAGAKLDIDLDALEEGRKVIMGLDPHEVAEFEKISSRLTAWARRAILDPLVSVGRYSADEANRMAEANQNYTPFFRIIDELGEALGQNTGTLRKISGGVSEERKIQNTLLSLIDKSQAVNRYVEQQRVRNYLGKMVEGNPTLLDDAAVVYQRPHWDKTGMAPKEARGKKQSGFLWEDGKRSEIYVNKAVEESLENLTPKQTDFVMDMARGTMRVVRAGAVATPQFVVRNPFRDIPAAAIYSKHGFNPFVDVPRAMYHVFGESDFYKELKYSGSSGGNLLQADAAHNKAVLADVQLGMPMGERIRMALEGKMSKGDILKVSNLVGDLKRMGPGTYGDTNIPRVGNLLLSPVRLMESAANLTEDITRTAVALRTHEKTGDMLKTVEDFRDAYIDFSRFGTHGRGLNLYHIFANAAIQDTDKFFRNMKSDPLGTSSRAFRWVTLPAVLNWYANHDDPEYQELPTWSKALFYHLGKAKVGEKEFWVKVPRPIGWLNATFGLPVHSALESAFGVDPDGTKGMIGRIADQTGVGEFLDPASLVPTAGLPAVEAMANYDTFRERPIEHMGDTATLPEQRYNEHTHSTSIHLGQKLGQSPKMVEHLARGYGGYWADAFLKTSDAVLPEVPGRAPDLGGRTKDIPFLGAFVDEEPVGFNSQSVHTIYERFEEVSKTRKAWRDLEGQAKKDFKRSHPELKDYDSLKRARDRIKDLSDARSEAMFSKSLSPEEKAAKLKDIDRKMTAIAQKALGRSSKEEEEEARAKYSHLFH